MFDTVSELITQIRLGEDSLLELKSVRLSPKGALEPHPESLAQEIAAFANSSKGGVLVLGVHDKTHEIEGLSAAELEAAELAVRNILNDRIDPPAIATIARIELPDSLGIQRAVLRVDIPRSLFVHKAPGGYYHRIGSSKREMSSQHLERLMQQRSQSRLLLFDEQAVPQTSVATLDERLTARFIEGSESPSHELLHKLGLLTHDAEGIERCTVSGVLIATQNPEQHLGAGACIEAVQYAGNEQDSDRQIASRRITGAVDQQIIAAYEFARGGMLRAAEKNPARQDKPAFSERAIFEAIVNAVAHRDYSISGSRIRLFLFDDRIEISSPGALPNTLSVTSMPHRQYTRNETLVGLLYRLEFTLDSADAPIRRGRFLETRGDGVRIMLKEAERLGAKPPVFEVFDEQELRVTLFASAK
jgi:ATP-dependent DNA helicase RecG